MPSLYESTVNTGEVASSNFTTLYNASGLSVPNAGAGSVTGNLNVGGNLTVQGNSLLIGDVTLQSTLSLPNYTFPLPDGTTDQVLVTDGNGNLYWTDVSAIPGADYNISATTATGGANLTLANTAGFTDSVKFAAGTNMSIVRTDANTITIATVADNIPDGTAQGQVLYWDGSGWTANNVITSLTAGTRLTSTLKSSTTTINGSILAVRDYDSHAYVTGDATTMLFGVDSASQAAANIGAVGFTYSATDPSFVVATSTDNFVTRLGIVNINGTDVGFDGVNLILNKNLTGVPVDNATLTVNRGSDTDATLTWNEATDTWNFSNNVSAPGITSGNITIGVADDQTITTNSGNLILKSAGGEIDTDTTSIISTNSSTFYLLNSPTTVNAFQGATALSLSATSGTTAIRNNLTVGGTYSQTGETMTINSDSTAADSYLYMKGSTEYLKWDNTNSRFELSDQLYITQTDIPAILERRNLSTAISPSEQKSSLRLINRVTDAANNDTVNTGPAVTFARTSGATDATERLFASMGSSWNGTDKTAQMAFTWSNDNFSEPTPGIFPGSYALLVLDTDYSQFYNDSVYIDYSTPGNQKTATSITGGNTLVFGTAHGFSIGERIKYMSTTQNGLTQFTFYYVLSAGFTTTQCQLGLTSTGTAVALTNGTGLTLNFAELINQVGINTITPGYTLDVNGDANVSGDIYVSGVHVNLTTPVHQGQFLYVSDDVTPTITNSSTIITDDASYRPIFQYDNSTAGSNATMFLRKNYGATPYTTGDGTHIGFRVDSDSQAEQTIANIGATYDATEPQIFLETNANANTTGPFVRVATFTTSTANIAGSTLVLDSDNVGAGNTVSITANRGSSGADVSIRWNESTDRWQDTTDGTTYLNLPDQNLDTTDDVSFAGVTVDNITTYNSQTTTTTSTSVATIASTAKISVKAIIKVTDNVTGEMQMLEALAFRKGTTAYLTTYAEMSTSAALATFTVIGTGGLTSILATPLSSNSTTFTVARISLD